MTSEVKKYNGYVYSSGADYWVEMEESETGEWVSISDYEKLKSDLLHSRVNSTHWETIGNNALSAQRNIEIKSDTYRELCGELLAQIKSIHESMSGMGEYGSHYYETKEAITKAEQLLGENNGNSN